VTDIGELLRTRLAAGAIPTAEIMSLALYHPQFGYYRQAQSHWGFDGKDYYTALDVGPLLGETLAVRLEAAWNQLGRPEVFTVLEPGAGRGWLGRDLLSAVSGAFGQALVYLHRDDNPAGRAAAEAALAPFLADRRAKFVSEGDPLPVFVGAVISNELFDALPAQPWRWDGGQWLRMMLSSEGPDWESGDPGDAGTWFRTHAEGHLRMGDGAAWNEGMALMVRELARTLSAGLFLTIDYGDSCARLVSKGSGIRRYRGHRVDAAWWEELGCCDLTADVDFTRLAHLLEIEGFHEAAHHSLSHWIRRSAPLSQWETEWQDLEEKDRLKRMENLLQLTLPGMMGERFRVLEAWKPQLS